METVPEHRPRVDVLAFPAPTTTRFVLVMTTLLTAGLFIGTWVHNGTSAGDRWGRTVAACTEEAFGSPIDPADPRATSARQEVFVACTASVERTRVAWAVGGLVAAGLGGIAVLYAAPPVLARRRKLRVPNPRLAGARQRVVELAAEVDVDPPPRLLIGDAKLQEAFSFGVPGRYTLVLPSATAIKWAKPALFDPTVRHELAHLSAWDVPLAWMTRSLRYAVAALLVVPVVVELVSGRLSDLRDYGWRAVILAIVALLVAASALRSREFDADVRSVRRQPERRKALAETLRSAGPDRGSRWRRPLSNHPLRSTRVAVLDRPERITTVTFLDGAAAGYLVGLVVPLLVSVLTAALASIDSTDLVVVLVSLLLGPLLGTTLGLALWRQAVVSRVSGTRGRVLPAAVGLAGGLLLGQTTSLSNTTLGLDLEHPGWVALGSLLAVGATYAVAGLAELSADVAPRLRRARSLWVVGVAVSSVVFGATLWLWEALRQAFEGAGWLLASGVLVTVVGSAAPAAITAALAGVALAAVLLARPAASAPPWLVEDVDPAAWPTPSRGTGRPAWLAGGACGVVAAVLVVTHPFLDGVGETGQAYVALAWVVAAGAGAAALAVSVLVPGRGPGLALLAGPVAALLGTIGLLVVGHRIIGEFNGILFETAVVIPVGLGGALTLTAAAAGALSVRARVPWVLVPVAGALLTVLGGIGALAFPDVIAPWATAASEQEERRASEQVEADIEVLAWMNEIQPDAISRIVDAATEADEIAGDVTVDRATMAQRLEDGPVADLAALGDELTGQSVHDTDLADLHAQLVAVVETKRLQIAAAVDYLRTGDVAHLDRKDELGARSEAQLAQMLEDTEALLRRVGASLPD